LAYSRWPLPYLLSWSKRITNVCWRIQAWSIWGSRPWALDLAARWACTARFSTS